ncbi:MAG: hypothetical protein IIX54_02560, partial [Clostridia bacterium]|nr:hypothetical protein [Clostridia bacterium]
TRNTKDVVDVVLNVPSNSLSCFSDIDAYSFAYKIIFTDKTTTEYEYYEEIEREGYEAPIVEYVGEYAEVGYDTYLQAGSQPVDVTYQGNTTTYYVQVESLVSWVSDTKVYGVNDTFSIKYSAGVEEPAWFRIRVKESGIYSPYRYNEDDFSTNFEYYSLDIVDSNNEAAWYSDDYYGWALNAGEDYVIKFDYIFASGHERNTIEFWFQKEASLKNGWSQNGGKWYYYENGFLVTGWRYIGTTWYYFNDDGIMQTGWQLIDSTWYYFNVGGAMQTGWQYIGGTWYYFNISGDMRTGWLQNGSVWYYLTDNGGMVTGWRLIDSNWYYFNASGAMRTGWQYIGNTWYFFNSGGDMRTGWMQNGSIWYYFTPGGHMAIGWHYIDSNWYYFYPGGNMVTGWLNLGGIWFYLAEGGNMVTGWQQIGYNWYYFNTSGVWIPQ